MSAAAVDRVVTHREARVNGVRLHYVEAGEGPLVLLLHGFPDFWYSWREQIPALAEAGFRVVAPDMRGYNLSDKPSGVGAYRVEALAADVEGLVHHLGAERATVVGHDWGGIAAYTAAMRHPAVVERLAILNVPHPQRMAQGLRRPRQLARSWYVFFFQLPFAPERLTSAGDFSALRRAMRGQVKRPGALTEEDLDRYAEAWGRPGTMTAAINYYRAAARRGPKEATGRLQVIEAPVRVIWGERDAALAADLADPSPRWVPNAETVRIPEAGHWVQADAPGRVNELLIEFARG